MLCLQVFESPVRRQCILGLIIIGLAVIQRFGINTGIDAKMTKSFNFEMYIDQNKKTIILSCLSLFRGETICHAR